MVARNVFGLLNLQIKTFGNGLERFALFINHVGEGFGVFSKLTHSGLLLIKRFNFTAHLRQALCLRGFDVVNADDVVAKLRFNRTHQITLLAAKDRGVKFRNHHAFMEKAEVSALAGAARVSGFFFGKLRELLGISLNLSHEFVGFFFRIRVALFTRNSDQDVACAAFFRRRETLKVLFVESLDVIFACLNVFVRVRRKNHVFNVNTFGHSKLSLVRIVVSLRFIVRHGNAL